MEIPSENLRDQSSIFEEIKHSLFESKLNIQYEIIQNYKEIMVGSINNLKTIKDLRSQQSLTKEQPKKDSKLSQFILAHEYVRTFSFENSLYIAYVSGPFVKVLRQRFVKLIGGQKQNDYEEHIFKLKENVCNEIIFAGNETNEPYRQEGSVAVIIPCLDGSVSVNWLNSPEKKQIEFNLEVHGNMVYSVGVTSTSNHGNKVEIVACLVNQKVFIYQIDLADESNKFIKHKREVRLFDSLINQLYQQRLRQNTDQLISSFLLVSRNVMIGISKDFKLKVINLKLGVVHSEHPLCIQQEAIGKLDVFKNIKVASIINNPLVNQDMHPNLTQNQSKPSQNKEILNQNKFSTNILIVVAITNSSISSALQVFNLELWPQEEQGEGASSFAAESRQLEQELQADEEEMNPFYFFSNVHIGDLSELLTYQLPSEIIDIALTRKGIFLAQFSTETTRGISFLDFESFGDEKLSISLCTVQSADFEINQHIQQDLEYLDNDDSDIAYREHPLNRMFMSDRFPLKLIHEFFGNLNLFKLFENYLGTKDIKNISDYLLSQNDFKFEADVKNSLTSLSNSWKSKFPIIAIHTDPHQSTTLPLIIRENGLFSLVQTSFLENLNFKLNELILSLKSQNEENEQDFTDTAIFEKYQQWSEVQGHKLSFEILPTIVELLAWSKFFLIPKVMNCLNSCPGEQPFAFCVEKGVQIASSSLSYKNYTELLKIIFQNQKDANECTEYLVQLLNCICKELFHENLEGKQNHHAFQQQPLLFNVEFSVWSMNLSSGSIRQKIRSLVQLGLSILSFLKFIHSKGVKYEEPTDLENIEKIIGAAYSVTLLFDRPLLYIERLNKLTLKDEEQTLDHILFLDPLFYFVEKELTLLYQISRNKYLSQAQKWLTQNSQKVELSLFQNLSTKPQNNFQPPLLHFLYDNHQYEISLWVSQLLNPSPAILYSQAKCLYSIGQYNKVSALLIKISTLIHVNPSVLYEGPWTQEKHILAVHQQIKNSRLSEDIKFLRFCVLHFFKESKQDQRCKYELSQIGLLLMPNTEVREDHSLKVNDEAQCKVEFLRSCFSYYLLLNEPYQSFNCIKQMNQISREAYAQKQNVKESIHKFVQYLCNTQSIGIVSELVYEDNLSQLVETEINESNSRLIKEIIENYNIENQRFVYLDNQLSSENLYKFNSVMNFYISIKDYKQAGLSQWELYGKFKIISEMRDEGEPIPKFIYSKLLQLQIVALKQAQSLFRMGDCKEDIIIYKNQQENGHLISKSAQESQMKWISVTIIGKILAELEARLLIENRQQQEYALCLTSQEQIIEMMIEFQEYEGLINFMNSASLDFRDLLIFLTEQLYRQEEGFVDEFENENNSNDDFEEPDYFTLIRRILLLSYSGSDYNKYCLTVLKAYGSCVSDIASSTGYKMKNLAFKINLPNIDTYLFTALSDFGEDKIVAEEILKMAQSGLQNINLQQIENGKSRNTYFPLQLIPKVLDSNSDDYYYKDKLKQISKLF